MKNNEYDAAEVIEIGPAPEIVLGEKIMLAGPDSAGMEPLDRVYEDQ